MVAAAVWRVQSRVASRRRRREGRIVFFIFNGLV
jgi:hypothetical protein